MTQTRVTTASDGQVVTTVEVSVASNVPVVDSQPTNSGLSTTDQIALGVGIGIGVPVVALLVIIAIRSSGGKKGRNDYNGYNSNNGAQPAGWK